MATMSLQLLLPCLGTMYLSPLKKVFMSLLYISMLGSLGEVLRYFWCLTPGYRSYRGEEKKKNNCVWV